MMVYTVLEASVLSPWALLHPSNLKLFSIKALP